jgi:hypothetical protein
VLDYAQLDKLIELISYVRSYRIYFRCLFHRIEKHPTQGPEATHSWSV